MLKTLAAGAVLGGAGRLSAVLDAGQAPFVSGNRRRPNILYVIPHDLGRHLGVYGRPVATPGIDDLAARGALLTQAHCNSPACMPSRCCAMTGLHAHRHGCLGTSHGWQLPADRLTVVDHLNAAGYETVIAGLQHEREPFYSLPTGEDPNRYRRNLRRTGESDEILAASVVDRAIAYLRAWRPENGPFYLNVGIREPHATTWLPSSTIAKAIDSEHRYGVDRQRDTVPPPGFPDNRTTRAMISRFNPVVRHLDAQVARLHAALEETGLAENTLFVFATDHGIFGPRHKTTCYAAGTEIAAFTLWPGRIASGLRVDHPIGNIDFMPTLLEAAGVPAPLGIDGRSFLGALTGEPHNPHHAIVTERNHHANYDPVRTVITPRFHYLRNAHPRAKRFLTAPEILALPAPDRDRWPNPLTKDCDSPDLADWPGRPAEELYDLQADPDEFRNLADDPALATVKAGLSDYLDRWMRADHDPVGDDPMALRAAPDDPGDAES